MSDQVRAALTGDFSDHAKILWVYMFVCGRGNGKAKLSELLGWTEGEFEDAAGELLNLGLATVEVGRYRATPFLLETVDPEEASRTPPALAEAVAAAVKMYNDRRAGANVVPIYVTVDVRKKFAGLIEWLAGQDVSFEQFFKFAIERTEFLRQKGQRFPTVELLAGPWLREQWVSRESESPAATEHAGRRYQDVGGLRGRLTDAGFARCAEMSKSDIRYILECAENMIADPTRFPEPPEDIRREVYWLKRAMEGGGAST